MKLDRCAAMLALVGTATSGSLGDAFTSGPYAGLPNWHPKHLTQAALVKRCTFRVLIPSNLPAGYHLQDCEIVYTVGDMSAISGSEQAQPLPPAQAVDLVYTNGKTGGWLDVLEARHVPGVSPQLHLDDIQGQGYFRPSVPLGTMTAAGGIKHGTDYGFVYNSGPARTIQQIQQRMAQDVADVNGIKLK